MTTTTPRTDEPATPEQPQAPKRSWSWRLLHRWHYTFVGVIGAVTFFCLSLTPSLLPRGFVLQGLVSGITAAIGYGLGVLAVWLVSKLSNRPLPGPRPVAWRWLAGVAAIAVALFLYLGSNWQREVHELMGMDPPPRAGFVLVLLVAALTGAGLVGLMRLLRRAAHGIGRLLGRWIPASTARVVAAFVVVVLALGVLNGGGARRPLRRGRRQFPYCQRRDRPGRGAARGPVAVRRPRLPGALGLAGKRGPQVRHPRAEHGAVAQLRRSRREAADPGLRRARLGTDVAGAGRARRAGAATDWRVRPQGTSGDHHHRHGLGRRGGGRAAGVPAQRRHRDGRVAVLIPAELDLVPRGQGTCS